MVSSTRLLLVGTILLDNADDVEMLLDQCRPANSNCHNTYVTDNIIKFISLQEWQHKKVANCSFNSIANKKQPCCKVSKWVQSAKKQVVRQCTTRHIPKSI